MAKFRKWSNRLSKMLSEDYPLSLGDELGGTVAVKEGIWRKIDVEYSIPWRALSDDGKFQISGKMELLISNRFTRETSLKNLEIRLTQDGSDLDPNEFYKNGNLSDAVLKYIYEKKIPLSQNPNISSWKLDSRKQIDYKSHWTFISRYFLLLSDLFNIFQLYTPQASGETLLEEIKGKISGLLLQIYNNEKGFDVDINNVVVKESGIHAFKIGVPVVVPRDPKISFIKSLDGDAPYMEVTLPRLKRYDDKTKFEINPNYEVSVKK